MVTLQLRQLDVTSTTQIDAYVRLGVGELWVYDGNEIKIYVLESGRYQQISISPTFPQLPVLEWITEALDRSVKIGRSPALRAFRQQVRQTV